MKLFKDIAAFALSMQVKAVKRAAVFIDDNLVVKLTSTAGKNPRRGANQVSYTLTIGRPNYAERQFIKAARKAGEALPVKRPQLKYFKGAKE